MPRDLSPRQPLADLGAKEAPFAGERIGVDELEELIVEGRLCRAPRRLARQDLDALG